MAGAGTKTKLAESVAMGGAAAEAAAGRRRRRAAESVFVVQQRGLMVERDGDDGGVAFEGNPDGGLWEDVATVTVPGGSRRETIIARAIERGLTLPATIRILPAGVAVELPVSLGVPAAPPVVIG